MSQVFRVAIQYDNNNGYIEYDLVSKKMKIELPNAAKCREVEQYLTSVQTLRAAQKTLVDFREWKAIPTDDVETFKTALARLWEKTDVHLDWSRPI